MVRVLLRQLKSLKLECSSEINKLRYVAWQVDMYMVWPGGHGMVYDMV